jgi:hypothetical protein
MHYLTSADVLGCCSPVSDLFIRLKLPSCLARASDILQAVDRGNLVVLVLLDLSVAFDTVDHESLQQRQRVTFGIDDTVHQYFQSVAYLGFYTGGPRPGGLGDGSPPVGSRSEAPVGGLGASSPRAEGFLQIYT